MITERSPLSFSQVNSHILGGHEEGLCSNQDNQYLIIKVIIKLHPGCIRSMLVISSLLHLMMRLNVSAFHLKVTFTAQIQIFKHLMPILSHEGKIGPKVQTQHLYCSYIK